MLLATTEQSEPPVVPPRLDLDTSSPSPPTQSQVQTQSHHVQAQEDILLGQRGQSKSSTLSSHSLPKAIQSPPTPRGRAASADRYLDRTMQFIAGKNHNYQGHDMLLLIFSVPFTL